MIDGYTVLNLFSVIIAPLVALAAPSLSVSKQATDSPGIGVTWTLTVSNTGDETATNVLINDTFPAGSNLGVRSAPTISPSSIGSCTYNNIDRVIVDCSIPALEPGQTATISFGTCRNNSSAVSNFAIATANGIGSATSNTVTGFGEVCPTPGPTRTFPPPQPTPAPTPIPTPPPLPTVQATPIPREGEPAIICDPAEVGCSTVLPRLGVRFSAARNPVICSINDPRKDCTPFQPTLGARYRGIPDDIKPDIRPGECSTAEDRAQFPRLYEGIPAVEVTFCEVQTYPEGLVQQGPQPVKNVAPADTSNLDGNATSINPAAVQGVACRGLPGDPWWAESCGCTCDEQCIGTDVATCLDTSGPVPTCVPIIRHDIAITSTEECEQDPQPDGHFDPVP